MIIYKPYTYLIGWSKLKKYYYGVRFAKKCNPNEFWVRYFTSSKLVKEYRLKYGEPDIIEIRKTFKTRETAILWEIKVLNRMKVLYDEKWLNQNVSGAVILNQETRKIIAEKLRGRTRADQRGKKRSKESKKKMSDAAKGRVPWNKGKELSEDHREKLKEAKIGYLPWNTGKTKQDNPSMKREGVNKGIKRGKRITNGSVNTWLKENESMPEGFYFGLTIKNKNED